MFAKHLLWVVLSAIAFPAWSGCRSHELTPPAQVRIAGDAVMIVVHQSSAYDARFATKRGIDEAIRYAKGRKLPTVYLQDDTPDEYYFMADCEPDYWVFSQAGEISFELTQRHVFIVGGHLELCMSVALHDILRQWARQPTGNFTVTYFMDAIYSNGKMIDTSDPFYGDFARFMGIVTHGRPGGEHWPKLSLLETMGIILREDHKRDYLRQILPRWDRGFPKEYEVLLQLNDSAPTVLRPGRGFHPPTLRFHFIDSAIDQGAPPGLAGP